MTRIKLLLLTLVALLLSACGGGASGHSAAYPSRSSGATADGDLDAAPEAATYEDAAPAAAPAEEMESAAAPAPGQPAPTAGAGAGEMADSDAASSSRTRSARPQMPAERPGLATRWGEYRESHVTTAPFYRADPGQPFASVRVFYNDATGVRAMAARSSVSDYDDNLFSAASRQLSVRILDGGGYPLPSARAGGRSYVVGEHGSRYVIQIRNHTGNRVEAVATVDGLDVIDGRSGSFRKRGYIVGPFASVEIEGFRRSHERVATFRFGSVRDSYAASKGNARNVGVIGVAFFHESGSRWPWSDEEVDRRHDADPFPGRYADPPPVW